MAVLWLLNKEVARLRKLEDDLYVNIALLCRIRGLIQSAAGAQLEIARTWMVFQKGNSCLDDPC